MKITGKDVGTVMKYKRAMSFGYELISETARLQEFPESGRMVPEYHNNYIRELLFRPIESCTESITTESSARSFAFGI